LNGVAVLGGFQEAGSPFLIDFNSALQGIHEITLVHRPIGSAQDMRQVLCVASEPYVLICDAFNTRSFDIPPISKKLDELFRLHVVLLALRAIIDVGVFPRTVGLVLVGHAVQFTLTAQPARRVP